MHQSQSSPSSDGGVVIPVSGGIPPLVRIATLIGIVLVFIVLGLVVWQSYYGHVWPSQNSMKVPLPAAPSLTTSK